jgi:hypothetical protein
VNIAVSCDGIQGMTRRLVRPGQAGQRWPALATATALARSLHFCRCQRLRFVGLVSHGALPRDCNTRY